MIPGIPKGFERRYQKSLQKISLKIPPDKNKGDKASEEKFKEASEAYHILSDEREKQIMISLDMLHLKVVVVADFRVLVDLIVHHSQIFLKIFSVILVAGLQEDLAIEEMI